MQRFGKTTLGVITCLGLALGTAAWSQEDQASDGTATSSDIASDLSLGEDGDTPSDLGQTYIKETNEAWEMRCLRTETPENDPCQMYQLLKDETDAAVAEFTLFRLPEGGKAVAGATVTVPLETALTPPLNIQIDGGKPKRYPYAFCTQIGCHARIGLTSEDVAAYKRGNEAVLTVVPAVAPDQRVTLKLSLSGFTASYDQVSLIEQ